MFGPEGRLIEIHSAEDQELAIQVMKAAESMFTMGQLPLPYWWSGLREADDGVWTWSGSNTSLTHPTYWHSNAVPEGRHFDCMQFLNGYVYEGKGGERA